MAKIDKIKEYIGWLKVLFALFFGIDISLIAFLFLHFEENSLFKDVLLILILIISLYITVFINSKILEKIDESEEL
jgi:MFS-type transporter involved in bile tolerance (Atg22 family)